MTDVAIRVENLSKQYQIGASVRHDRLKDLLACSLNGLFSRSRLSTVDSPPSALNSQLSTLNFPPTDTIWALKDVSFEVKKGETLGIIGANGAGKSTLLKILARITEPASGRAEIYGRIGSLLEVGTGFDRELTGRENVYLNGAILGMTKREIERKFEKIVDFSGVEKFIDTPVKRYSSGMYVRLAFAVAAHLEPEILIVDEVLAVGDTEFQKKCLGKMDDVTKEGRTVLFVSHNMESIQHLCRRVILLESGRISKEGLPREVVRSYLSKVSSIHGKNNVSIREWNDRVTNGQARIVRFEIDDGNGQETNSIHIGSTLRFTIGAEFYMPHFDPCFGVLVQDETGETILDIRSTHGGLRIGRVEGQVVIQAFVERFGLYPGDYLISPWITESSSCKECLDWVKHCCKLRVQSAPGPHGDLRLDPAWGKYWVPSRWAMR